MVFMGVLMLAVVCQSAADRRELGKCTQKHQHAFISALGAAINRSETQGDTSEQVNSKEESGENLDKWFLDLHNFTNSRIKNENAFDDTQKQWARGFCAGSNSEMHMCFWGPPQELVPIWENLNANVLKAFQSFQRQQNMFIHPVIQKCGLYLAQDQTINPGRDAIQTGKEKAVSFAFLNPDTNGEYTTTFNTQPTYGKSYPYHISKFYSNYTGPGDPHLTLKLRSSDFRWNRNWYLVMGCEPGPLYTANNAVCDSNALPECDPINLPQFGNGPAECMPKSVKQCFDELLPFYQFFILEECELDQNPTSNPHA